jgi:hypothetical protein
MSHPHADPHGHAPAAASPAHGHGQADLPPEPTTRSITPAPADYATALPMPRLLWPLLWFAVFALLLATLRAAGWPEWVPPAGGH